MLAKEGEPKAVCAATNIDCEKLPGLLVTAHLFHPQQQLLETVAWPEGEPSADSACDC